VCAFVIPGRIRHPLASNRRAAGDAIVPCGPMRETAPFSIKMSEPCRAELCKLRMCPPASMIAGVPRGCRSIDANADCTGGNRIYLPAQNMDCLKHYRLSFSIKARLCDRPANGFVASERNAKFTKFGSELHAASLITACINTAAPASRSSGRVSSRTLWLRPPTLGTNIIPDGQIRAIICAS